VPAMFNRAAMLDNGEGVEQDEAAAASLYAPPCPHYFFVTS
jgi:hypothetical protein